MDDVQDVKLGQIVPVPIIGEWKFHRRMTVFVVTNGDEIEGKFTEYFIV